MFTLILITFLLTQNPSTANNITVTANITLAAPPNTTASPSETRQVEASIINQPNIQKDFRPSPQFDENFEYNRFPVKPVQPEAKHKYFDQEWPIQRPDVNINSKVAFPRDHQKGSSKERPYPFVTSGKTSGVEDTQSRTFGYGFDGYGGVGYGHSGPGVRRPAYGNLPEKYGNSGIDPIKKVLGLLAAVIPIGLLISALTPSVVQVVPVNMSQTRNRADAAKRLLSTLNKASQGDQSDGCEERILCELLLSAGLTNNAEQHVENLLQRFSEKNRNAVEKAEELQRVYEGVRKQNCGIFVCSNIKENKT